jgi:hypothetical protein
MNHNTLQKYCHPFTRIFGVTTKINSTSIPHCPPNSTIVNYTLIDKVYNPTPAHNNSTSKQQAPLIFNDNSESPVAELTANEKNCHSVFQIIHSTLPLAQYTDKSGPNLSKVYPPHIPSYKP